MADIEKANETLAAMLDGLQEQYDYYILKNVAKDMNELLLSAIVENSGEVNAVVVDSSVDINRSEEDLPERHSRFSGRFQLKQYLGLQSAGYVVSDLTDVEFVKHLPYAFEEAEKFCRMKPQCVGIKELVKAHEPVERDGSAFIEVVLGNGSLIGNQKAYLYPDEVKSIKFDNVADDAFSPIMIKKKGNDAVRAAYSPVMHYLAFRMFYGDLRDEVERDNRDDPMRVQNILIPSIETCLHPHEKFMTILDGFAVHMTKEGPILYEMIDASSPSEMHIPYSKDDTANMVIGAIANNRNNPNCIKTYEGNDIIKKLHQVVPQPQ